MTLLPYIYLHSACLMICNEKTTKELKIVLKLKKNCFKYYLDRMYRYSIKFHRILTNF